MGLIGLSWEAIESWVKCQGLEDIVTPWELDVVRKMSRAYAGEFNLASDVRRPQPFIPIEVSQDNRDRVESKLKAIFANRKKKKG